MKNYYHTIKTVAPDDSNIFKPVDLYLEDSGTFHAQCKARSDWSYRTHIEALSSECVLWCTFTYDEEHAVNSYDKAVKEKAGKINKYFPRECYELFDQYVNADFQDRCKILKKFNSQYDTQVNTLHLHEKFSYFVKKLGLVPEIGTSEVYPEDKAPLMPLYCFDPYRYYFYFEHSDLLSETYKTRTGRVMQGFNNFESGWIYPQKEYTLLYKELKNKFGVYFPHYNWTTSDNTLLCKAHISEHIHNLQQQFKKDNNGNRLRFIYAGEYGSANHRAHYHALIFYPKGVRPTKEQLEIFSNWKYGKVVDIEFHSCQEEDFINNVIDYVGKHFVKFDKGNFFQQKLSPIFRQTSCYDGGIGYQLTDPSKPAFNKDIYDELVRLSGAASPDVLVNGYPRKLDRYYRRKMFPNFRRSLSELQEYTHNNICKNLAPIFSDLNFKPQKILKNKVDAFKEIINFVADTEYFCGSSFFGEIDTNLSFSENLDFAFDYCDELLIEVDKKARSEALSKYVEHKNNMRKAKYKLKLVNLII